MQPAEIIVLVFLAVVAIIFLIWERKRVDRLVRQWARANSFTILRLEHRYIRKGPYFWKASKSQEVVFVKVRDNFGTEKSAYLRVGGFLSGVMTDNIDVTWLP
jgi:long-subunit acyl-CoA synthetase (AMP-forming)